MPDDYYDLFIEEEGGSCDGFPGFIPTAPVPRVGDTIRIHAREDDEDDNSFDEAIVSKVIWGYLPPTRKTSSRDPSELSDGDFCHVTVVIRNLKIGRRKRGSEAPETD